jgi:hypothetical protein
MPFVAEVLAAGLAVASFGFPIDTDYSATSFVSDCLLVK